MNTISTRDIFTGIEKHFNGFPPITEWEIENGEHFDSLVIQFGSKIMLHSRTIEGAVDSLVKDKSLKNPTFSVYNNSAIPFFGIIINYNK